MLTWAAAPAPETIALEYSRDPVETVILEKYDGKATVTLIKDTENAGNKEIPVKQYEAWASSLGKHLKKSNDRGCDQPFHWTLSRGSQKSEYSYCPEKSARFEALDKVKREIRASFGND